MKSSHTEKPILGPIPRESDIVERKNEGHFEPLKEKPMKGPSVAKEINPHTPPRGFATAAVRIEMVPRAESVARLGIKCDPSYRSFNFLMKRDLDSRFMACDIHSGKEALSYAMGREIPDEDVKRIFAITSPADIRWDADGACVIYQR